MTYIVLSNMFQNSSSVVLNLGEKRKHFIVNHIFLNNSMMKNFVDSSASIECQHVFLSY